MAVLKWSRLEEEVEVGNLPESASRFFGGSTSFVRKLAASLAFLVLLLVLVVTRTEQQRLNQYFEFTLNSTIEKASSLRAELQEVGARVNSANGQVANLRTNLAGLSTAKPWREGMDELKDRVEKGFESATRERAEAGGNISLAMGNIKKLEMDTKNLTGILEKKSKEFDHLKKGVEVLSNSSQSVASLVHSRLDIVEKSSQDLSNKSFGLEKNVFSRIAALQFGLERVQKDSEEGWFEQENLNEEFSEELAKIAAALNNSFSHWKELQAGHTEVADKTMEILAALQGIRSAHSTSTEREATIDGVEAETEAAPSTSTSSPSSKTPSGSSTPSAPSSSCSGSKIKKLKNITCTASSQFGPAWSCKKAFDNKLKMGKRGSAWASRGEGVGAWILATFSRPVKIVKLKILQRHNPVEANKQVSLETSSGWSQTAGLPAKGDRYWNIITLAKPVTTSWVKIKVKAVYGTVNNGFKEIQIFGC